MTGWTISGMTASQCGVPLSSFSNNTQTSDDYPGATCIGDLLARDGYDLNFIGGADGGFSGKTKFYQSHGFQTIWDRKKIQLLHNNSLNESEWGIYDDQLLTFAAAEITNLNPPFGLVLLTLDTHAPNGHSTPSCKDIIYRDGSNSYLNSLSCTDFLVGSFIEKLLQYENLVIILASDHLSMSAAIDNNMGENQRENLFAIINSRSTIVNQKKNRTASSLDLAPTILGSLGYDVDEFAFGRNLYKDSDTLSETFGQETFNDNLTSWRKKLWDSWYKSNTSKDRD